MSILDNEKVLEYLKEEFAKRWPEAAEIILKGHESRAYRKAACLWLGFKKGFELGHDFAHSEPLED